MDDIHEQLALLKKQLHDLEAKVNALASEYPADGTEYEMLDNFGGITETRWNDDEYDKERFAIGNVFVPGTAQDERKFRWAETFLRGCDGVIPLGGELGFLVANRCLREVPIFKTEQHRDNAKAALIAKYGEEALTWLTKRGVQLKGGE